MYAHIPVLATTCSVFRTNQFRDSRPVFKVEEWKLSAALDKVMSIAGLQVAFISDTREVQMSQQYIALLGRQRGLKFETFDSEPAAVAWLTRP